MPAFLSQRSLDSRFRGNDGFRGNDASRGNDGFSGNDASRGNATFPRATASDIPAYPSFPPTNHPRLPPFPPTCHSRESGNPLRLHHSPRSSSPTPIGDQESKAIRPMPAFLSQRSLDSRFRGNDGFSGNDASRGNATFPRATASAIPAYPSFPHFHHSRLPPLPPTVIPAHLSFPRKRESTAPPSFPPKLVPDPDWGAGTQGQPSNAGLPVAKVPRFPLSRE